MATIEAIRARESAFAAPHRPPVKGGGQTVDAKKLEQTLREQLDGEVRFDDGSRALYAADASNYRQAPIGVVLPKTKQDIIRTVAACRQAGAPILSRGGGTSLAGQCCNVAVVMDMSKYYNRILQIDVEKKEARVQPGLVLDNLKHAAQKYGLTFGPDPATHNHCTIGGMLGNNSCGTHAQMAGKMSDNTISLEILLYDGTHLEVGSAPGADLERIIARGGRKGEIYSRLKDIRDRYGDEIRRRFPKIPRLVSGYNLAALLQENGFDVAQALVGTEATCVTILEATVRLIPNPAKRSLVLLGYPSIYEAGDHVPQILKYDPIALEGLDQMLVDEMKKKHIHKTEGLLPEGHGWLMVEFGGDTKAEVDAKASAMIAELKALGDAPTAKLFDDPKEEEEVWEVRESGLGATAFVPGSPDTWEGWEDSAVAPDRVGEYLRDLHKLYNKYHYQGALYGHFGQGCIHTRITFDLLTHEGLLNFRAFLEEASDLVVKYNGSFSGEHGDGQSRGELLPKMFGHNIIRAFEEFKEVWDPENKMNPGKVVYPYKILDNLRLGTTYNPWNPPTYFQFPGDKHEISRAALRCVGVGKCRREEGGTMCPSYMVTREEMHSTRGRAHLLFEMLRGETIKGGWRDSHVKEALDLCLACKGCKGDCPVNVDMATLKAEFLAHYYSRRIRPPQAYAFGFIHLWAEMASKVPRIANFFTHAPIFGRVAKWAANVAPERKLPPFAKETFRDWFRERDRPNSGGPPVILWADTFNNYFTPGPARAAAQALEYMGYDVLVPRANLCCGRPLYDYGFLGTARKWLENILDELRPEIRAGVPFVGLEPSCVSVFRDELLNLLPQDKDAGRLSQQTYLLSEFLMKDAPRFAYPKLGKKAIVQGHCHHTSVLNFKSEEDLLERLGVEAKIPDSGCCGMAGAFGYEKDHHEVSVSCGERVILPLVRQTPVSHLIIADGFSCREQISQGTGRSPLHVAEVLYQALQLKSQV